MAGFRFVGIRCFVLFTDILVPVSEFVAKDGYYK